MIFELTVIHTEGLRSRDTRIVNMISRYEPPEGDAGQPQTALLGTRVALDGSGSSDPNGEVLHFRWTQTAGIPVTFSDPATANPALVAPDIDTKREKLVVQLTVTGPSGLEDQDKVTVANGSFRKNRSYPACPAVVACCSSFENSTPGRLPCWERRGSIAGELSRGIGPDRGSR